MVDLARVLDIADHFLAALGDPAFRADAENLESREQMVMNPEVEHWRQLARELQACLERIFFDDFLADRARTYLSF